MNVGSWGNILIFEVSDDKILTFNKLTRSVGSEWAKHSRIGLKDKSEFVRPTVQKLTFTISLNAMLGVRPRAMLEAIEKAIETGQVNTFVVGGKKIGKNRWKIKSVSEAWDTFLNKGELVKAKVNVTMEEYL